MAATKKRDKYEVSVLSLTRKVAAPALPYAPLVPKKFRPAIGLIGCGGITTHHLTAYKKAGYNVAAFCDTDRARAEERRSFYPKAEIYDDYTKLLARDDIDVVDIATHPPQRPPIIEAALNARKHVLSQKPFVLDLDIGERLADLADQRGVKLAVNQNGRWAPHFSYLRQAIQRGVIGKLFAAHLSVHWDHNWVHGTPFDKIRHCVLYDFAIHWFDILTCFMGQRAPKRVYASYTASPSQRATPPMLGQALIEYDDAQATLAFDADTKFGAQDRTYLAGSDGTITSVGPNLSSQKVQLHTKRGIATPKLKGSWFPDGFHGTMGELLCAIEEKREPSNSARNNLRSLALCFAAIASSESHAPVVPGTVQKLPSM